MNKMVIITTVLLTTTVAAVAQDAVTDDQIKQAFAVCNKQRLSPEQVGAWRFPGPVATSLARNKDWAAGFEACSAVQDRYEALEAAQRDAERAAAKALVDGVVGR